MTSWPGFTAEGSCISLTYINALFAPVTVLRVFRESFTNAALIAGTKVSTRALKMSPSLIDDDDFSRGDNIPSSLQLNSMNISVNFPSSRSATLDCSCSLRSAMIFTVII